MKKQILIWPHPILRQVSTPFVGTFQDAANPDTISDAKDLADTLIDIMVKSKGAGLAANQIGVTVRAFAIDVGGANPPEKPFVLFNPQVTEVLDKGKQVFVEGCLSIPTFFAEIERAKTINVVFTDVNGAEVHLDNISGILADAIQHENDHLNGITFVEKLGVVKQDQARNKLRKFTRSLKKFVRDAPRSMLDQYNIK